ncbi:carboxypeptidase-like regulatory domain-containing protein [Kordia algicida OT-1]|uniref:Putative outer membrane protein n=1 Tax=Kordia algicida OT-1 TaxID=391587 RepID=A9DZJ3_9FLAO|nr:carboxypeptidase-like regulatory domain-containing protein [Kordia algicida]EDP95734.1 putative outer membrane protein [Kordia algicida OT-1]
MKHPEIIVSIPEPCHEDWNKMSPTEKGKFCNVCTKEVIDFSAKSDEEIINHFSKNGNLCGRFHVSQLGRKLIADRKKRNHWLSYAASLLLPMALFSQETKSTNHKKSKIEKVDNSHFKSLNISSLERKNTSIKKDSIVIKGTITDESGMPLPGASIVIKNTTIGKTTDFDGNYSITVKVGDEIQISYVGFTTKAIKITKTRLEYNAKLESGDDLVAVTVVGGACFQMPGADEYGYVSDYDKTWYPKPMTKEEIKERDQRTENYFKFQKKKWKEKRAKRRAARKAKNAQNKS